MNTGSKAIVAMVGVLAVCKVLWMQLPASAPPPAVDPNPVALEGVEVRPCPKVWQPLAVAREPDANRYPYQATRVGCLRRAIHSVKHVCYHHHGPQARARCISGTLPLFVCVEVPDPRCEGPTVEPGQAELVG